MYKTVVKERLKHDFEMSLLKNCLVTFLQQERIRFFYMNMKRTMLSTNIRIES